MKAFTIPKVVPLPGWPVKVRLVEQAEIDAKVGEFNGADAWFDYDKRGAVILISKKLSRKMQRACLAHELQHAIIDYLDVMIQDGIAEPSPRKKAG